MKRIWYLISLISFVLAACTAAAPTTPPPTAEPAATAAPPPTAITPPQGLVITDDLGRTIELDGPAQAIVTLGGSIVESLFALGAGDQIVGREEFSTYPPEALEITNIGSLFGELPAEAMVALEPDLVIAPEIITVEQVRAIEELGLQVYWQANPVNFSDLYENLRDLAKLTGREPEAEALIEGLSGRVAAVEAKVAAANDFPAVFYELDATDPENPYTTGSGTFIDTIIVMSGGINVGSVLEGNYAQLSSEEIIVQNPDVIILADAAYGISPQIASARPGWDSIEAVRTNRVYPFDPFLVSVPGPRLVDGLETMAALLHPELFE